MHIHVEASQLQPPNAPFAVGAVRSFLSTASKVALLPDAFAQIS